MALNTLTNITYVSQILKGLKFAPLSVPYDFCPALVFDYEYHHNKHIFHPLPARAAERPSYRRCGEGRLWAGGRQ